MFGKCQVCGEQISFNPEAKVVACQACGSEYQVVKKHYSKSTEKSVTATKIPTRIIIYLQDVPGGSEVTGKTFPVGTTINVRCVLEWQDSAGVWRWLLGKKIAIYHRHDSAVDKDYEGTPTSNGYYDLSERLYVAGVHTFWAEFLGDDTYAGCEQVEGLSVQEFSVSPEKSLVAGAALSVLVKDFVTKKPIAGAHVRADTFEAVTDESGTAVFAGLAAGSYLVKAEKSWYVSADKRVELTEAGAAVDLSLIPIWVFPAGMLVVGGLIFIGTKAFKWH